MRRKRLAAILTLASFLALVLFGAGFVGCTNLPPVSVCYEHPKYGAVCVSVGGKTFERSDLTPAEKAEVDAWLKEKRP